MVEVDVAEITFAEALVATHAFELAAEMDLDSDFAVQIADYCPSENFACCPNLSRVALAFAFGLAVAVAAAVRSFE